MYAIFRAAGFQYRAELGDVLRLPSLDADVGETLTFDEVLLGSADGEVRVGRPTVDNAAVRAEVLSHDRADKVIVFKFKRRKNVRRKQGHRQDYTEIRVSEIDLGDGMKVSLESERAGTKKKADGKKKKASKKASTEKGSAEAAESQDTSDEAAAKPKKKKATKKASPKAKKADDSADAKPKKKTKASASKKKKKDS